MTSFLTISSLIAPCTVSGGGGFGAVLFLERLFLMSKNATMITAITMENRRIGKKTIAITASARYDNYLCLSNRFFVFNNTALNLRNKSTSSLISKIPVLALFIVIVACGILSWVALRYEDSVCKKKKELLLEFHD
jgi:hypothetical protein